MKQLNRKTQERPFDLREFGYGLFRVVMAGMACFMVGFIIYFPVVAGISNFDGQAWMIEAIAVALCLIATMYAVFPGLSRSDRDDELS